MKGFIPVPLLMTAIYVVVGLAVVAIVMGIAAPFLAGFAIFGTIVLAALGVTLSTIVLLRLGKLPAKLALGIALLLTYIGVSLSVF